MLRARFPGWTIPGDGANLADKARYPSGKGEVCKTFIRRFDSDPRLQRFPFRWRSSEELVFKQSRDSNKSRAKHAQSTWFRSKESYGSPSDMANTLTKLMTGGEDCLRECAADRSSRVQRPGDSSAESVSKTSAAVAD